MISMYLTYMVPRIGLVLLTMIFGLALVGCASLITPKTPYAHHATPLQPGTKVEVFLGHYTGCRGEIIAQLGGNRYLTRLVCVSWEGKTYNPEESVQGEYMRKVR